MLGIMVSPVSLKQGLPLELGRHHEDSEAGCAAVGSRVFHFLRGRPGWMASWVPGAAPRNPCSPLVESISPGRSTHHVVRLQVPLKLFPEIIGAEIHGCSPMGGWGGGSPAGMNPQFAPAPGTSALTDATSAHTPTSGPREAGASPALPPSAAARVCAGGSRESGVGWAAPAQ